MIRKGTFLYRVMAASGLKLIAAAEWLISKNSPNNTFFDTNAFPWTKTLESSYPQIKDELHFVLERGSIPDLTKLSEEQKRIVPENKWKTFILLLWQIRRRKLLTLSGHLVGNWKYSWDQRSLFFHS